MLREIYRSVRFSRPICFLRDLIPNFLVNFFVHFPLAFAANIFFFFPSRRIKAIGVTGTDGKTTTATLLYAILSEAGKKVGLVTSVSARLGENEIDTGFHVTSPDPWLLQRLIKRMADEGYEYAVLEATSHGLDQFRFFGVKFLAAVLTNVTREHLDYHRTFQNYLEAKSKLFTSPKIAVINRDDRSYSYLAKKIRKRRDIKLITYGIKNEADFTPETFPFKTKLVGEYNRYNCLAAIAVASNLGVSSSVIRRAVARFSGVEGRMEEVPNRRGLKVVIDFAHTPNALENILKTLRQRLNKSQKLVVVFGCAGLRDRGKRPIMGEIAAKYADVAVLTAEDPRTESVEEIIEEIARGCRKWKAEEIKFDGQKSYKKGVSIKGESLYLKIPDRRQAIRTAINFIATKGDTVVICGKGHEKSMCFGTIEHPWSDRKEVETALGL